MPAEAIESRMRPIMVMFFSLVPHGMRDMQGMRGGPEKQAGHRPMPGGDEAARQEASRLEPPAWSAMLGSHVALFPVAQRGMSGLPAYVIQSALRVSGALLSACRQFAPRKGGFEMVAGADSVRHIAMMTRFALPPDIAELIAARDKVRGHYAQKLRAMGSNVELSFTLDGNLIGDLGEALAADLFGITLVETKSHEAIDGFTPDGRSVQVKATGTRRGPAFRQTETRADHLIFLDLDLENATGEIVYNGPEHYAVAMLPEVFVGQRSLTRGQIRAADLLVRAEERLPRRKTT